MNLFAAPGMERSAAARGLQIWIPISLTDRAERPIFAASKLLPEPTPPHDTEKPAYFRRHAPGHDAPLFLRGNRRLLLLIAL
jgi:hypothetical protein